MNSLKTSVLFLVFNRPDNTKKVFEAIALVKPEKLYIAADGPRFDNLEDEILCLETRKIIDTIDWPCELLTLFRTENLGARYACTTAIDWFFDQEEEGIILEDDCVPGIDFFGFCSTLLEKYRNDPRIMHIGGTNLQFGNKRGNASYYFSSIPAVWGWASWRRVWKNYDPEMEKFEKFEQENQMINVFPDKRIADWVSSMARMIYEKKVIAWDYPLGFYMVINNGLSIVPNVNLVSNIGFGNQSTHTKDSSHAHANIPVNNIEQTLIHPKFFIPHKNADLFQLRLTVDNIKSNKVNKVRKVSLIQKIKNLILTKKNKRRKLSNLLGYFTAIFITLTVIIILQHLPGKRISLSISAFCMSVYLFFYTLSTLSKNSNEKSKLTHYMLASTVCCVNVGIMASFLHFTFANNIIFGGLVFFSFVYAPFLYIEKSNSDEASKLMYAFGILGLSIFSLGILFDIMRWHTATVLLLSSFAIIFLIYFPMYFTNRNISTDKKSQYLHKTFFNILIGMMLAFYICTLILSIKL